MSKTITRSIIHRGLLAPALVLVAMLLPSTDVGANAGKLTRMQLDKTMALPGATLPPGSYSFEIATPLTSANVVVVKSARGQVHFHGYTQRVDRPRHLAFDQVLTVGEAPAGKPIPIAAWYPVGFDYGYEFVY